MKVMFVSLGCDKNLVDTENMLGILNDRGFTFTDDEMEAEVIAVNTCCFIQSRKVLTRFWKWQNTKKTASVKF